jgi:hypothetical protein
MEGIVYLLCAGAAAACAVLLFRGYRRSRARLLIWSAVCFTALSIENLILFVDLIVVPATDISALRLAAGLVGVVALLYGLVWEKT